MPDARIIPDGRCSLCPMHSGNAIVIDSDQAHDVVSNHLVFIVIDSVDSGDMETNAREDALPSGLTIRSDHRMGWRELHPNVQWRSSRRHNFVVSSFTGSTENRLCAGRRQTVQKLSHGRRNAIIATARKRGRLLGNLKAYISYPEHQSVSPPWGGVSSIKRQLKSEGQTSNVADFVSSW